MTPASGVRNLCVLVGLAWMFIGLWWESKSLALIVIGGLLFACGALSTWSASRK